MNRAEALGRIVRAEWVKWCIERGVTEVHKVCPYDEMPEDIKDVDNRIGMAVAACVEAQNSTEIASLTAEVARLIDENKASSPHGWRYHISEFGPDGSEYGAGIVVDVTLEIDDIGHSDKVVSFSEPQEYKLLRERAEAAERELAALRAAVRWYFSSSGIDSAGLFDGVKGEHADALRKATT